MQTLKHRQSGFLLALLLTLMALCGLGSAAFAQTDQGRIVGTVKDQAGAVIANATVAVKNERTGDERTVIANQEGAFAVTNLKPSSYRIIVTAANFAKTEYTSIELVVGQELDLSVELKPVGATESVTIIGGDDAALDTSSARMGANVNQQEVQGLPLNGRQLSQLYLQAPGALNSGSGTFSDIRFSGRAVQQNAIRYDGVEGTAIIDSSPGNLNGEIPSPFRLQASLENVQEFRVDSNSYPAEYGTGTGGQVSVVTKSGSNKFHGSVFEYMRNDKLDARNWFDRATKSPLKLNQFGASLGGPIIKDKFFYFFSYDQQKRDFPGLGIFGAPNYLDGVNRTTLTGKGLTAGQIDETLAFITSLTGTVPRKGDQLLLLPKLDWQINSKNNFSINYNRLRWDSPAGVQTQATNTRGRASFGDDFVKVDWGTIRLTSTIKPTLINEFRVQYARDLEQQISQTPLAGEPRTALNGSAPDVGLQNGLNFGKPNFLERKSYPNEKRTQFTDNVTASLGANTLKFGVDINRVTDELSNLFTESGSFFYNNLNDFIIDYVNWKTPLAATLTCAGSTRLRGKCYSGNYVQGFGATGAEFSTTDYNFYAQYDWKFLPRVTFNGGLRYEYQKLPDAQLPNPSSATIPNTGYSLNQATSSLPSDSNNFGPRVGFAVAVTDDGKTSVRGGYGLYFGRTINSTIYNALLNTGAAGGQFQVSLQPTAATAPIFPNVLTTVPTGAGEIQYFSPDFGNSAIHQADVIFEREVLRNTNVSVSYLFSLGRNLPIFIDRNLNVPTETRTFTVNGGPLNGQTFNIPVFTGARPNTSFTRLTEIASLVKSEYNALVLQANRRLTGGFQLLASYTLSKATDDNQTSQTFTTGNVPFNIFDIQAERGRSRFDRRHKFVASAIYAPRLKADNKVVTALIDGWSIAPIFQLYTGLPYDGLVSGNLTGGTVGGLNGAGSSNNRLPLLERNAFTAPGVKNFDLRLSRKFYIKEKMNIEFLGEAFNVLNRTQFTGVNTAMYNLSGTALTYQAAFGTLNEAGGTLYRERQIQLGLRFQF